MTDDRFAEDREAMVRKQIAARGIDDPRLLQAMRIVPRHLFVPEHLAIHAYEDRALPIEAQQTISQPYIVALMISAAKVGPGDRVLEVGGGSGYAAAVLGRIATSVVSIERIATLAAAAKARIANLGMHNVEIVVGDGTKGRSKEAPYDAILVAATTSSVPPALLAQLADGGRLVIPLGGAPWGERLVLFEKQHGKVVRVDLGGVRFVPLIEDPDGSQG